MLELLEDYIVVLIIGVIIGALATRLYYEKTKNYTVGKIIESAMIKGNINELINQCKDLQQILIKMNMNSEELYEQIRKSGDIESTMFNINNIQEIKEITSSNEENDESFDNH